MEVRDLEGIRAAVRAKCQCVFNAFVTERVPQPKNTSNDETYILVGGVEASTPNPSP